MYHLLQTSLCLASYLMVQLIGVNTLKCNATKIGVTGCKAYSLNCVYYHNV